MRDDDQTAAPNRSSDRSSRTSRGARVGWLISAAALLTGAFWLSNGVSAAPDAARSKTPTSARPAQPVRLRDAKSFANLTDAKQRSRALFAEAGKVIQHPRCVNCHPAGDAPLQGNGEPHVPGAVRGDDGFGAVAMRCQTCHQAENYAPSGVPGHPKWHVAPLEAAWQGKTLSEICAQIKDQKRNGGMDMPALLHHMAEDTLVGWAWNPGANREPAPGTQKVFGELIAAWIASGAECP